MRETPKKVGGGIRTRRDRLCVLWGKDGKSLAIQDATGAVTGTAEKAGGTLMDAGKGLLNTAKTAVEGVGNTAKSAGETVLETGKALINKNPVKAAE